MDEGTLELSDRLIRSMSPERKLLLSEDLRRTAWLLKAAWLRSQHADKPEAWIQEQVRTIFADGGT